jgi:hypothetical protein
MWIRSRHDWWHFKDRDYVVDKLGFGGFSTTYLTRETKLMRYVAVIEVGIKVALSGNGNYAPFCHPTTCSTTSISGSLFYPGPFG